MNREASIDRLKTESFDILVIGGGATGSGVALDAATRGLSVALVERDDFASGTSSRSTKLIHGGVRYLEQAVLKFDRSQFKLVRDALHERATLLKIAPHLARPLAILTPLYNRLEVPYYRTGLKLYDRLAGKASIRKSYFVGAKEALQKFPMLKKENLRGGVVYYDGQFDDARMNIGIAITASDEGAAVANHVEVIGLLKTNKKLSGAKLRDTLTNEEWEVRAKVIVNAAGPFGDAVRKLDDPKAAPLLTASSGTHIILEKNFSPPSTGLLIPKTEDGRVLFLLPWLGHTLVGTTDQPAPIEANPKPSQSDIEYILRQLQRYFALKVNEEHILASWTGLRPLVSNPKAADTARLSRDHVIHESDTGLVTIAGGKWTTYRKMGLDTVNHALQVGNLKPLRQSQTERRHIAGGAKFEAKAATLLGNRGKLESDIAIHLNHAYGDRAPEVVSIAIRGFAARLVPGHPFIEAEVIYGAKHESARTIVDILSRRTRLSFLDKNAALNAIPNVAKLLAEALGWNLKQVNAEIKSAQDYLS